MAIYVKNNFNPDDNNKILSVLRWWTHSLYYMKALPGETIGPIELPNLEDKIIITIAPDSPMRECTKPSRVTYDECLDNHLEITPPSVMLDYPHSVEVKDNKRKVSITHGRHDWQVTIFNPEKEIDEWTPGIKPENMPKKPTVVVGDDVADE
ncbi:MAG: hypothetical protein GY765_28365 [bacterium]|nr:hypothetical protein [bacterium]